MKTAAAGLVASLILVQGCVHVPTPEEQARYLERTTGLHAPAGEPGNDSYLEKVHRGYPVLFRPQMGNVWGRFAARVAITQTAPELGRVGRFLSGTYESGVGTVVGSPLDRALSEVIGQPLSFFLILKHGKPHVSRLDVLSPFSTIRPSDPQPKQGEVGFRAGSIYSSDARFAATVMADHRLMTRLGELRSQYIRVDDKAATFMFAGSETEWSSTLREHGGYPELLTSIMDILADLADRA